MRTSSQRWLRFVALVSIACIPTCNCSKDKVGLIGPKSEHEVQCHCVVNFLPDNVTACAFIRGSHPNLVCPPTSDFPVCLPPELNTATASPVQLNALNALSDAEYSDHVTKFCELNVADDLKAVMGVTADTCGAIDSVKCEPAAFKVEQPATIVNGICDLPCVDVPCNQVNCNPDESESARCGFHRFHQV